MIPAVRLSTETLLAEDGMCVSAGVAYAVREDPALGEAFRQWVARSRKQPELKQFAVEIVTIGQRISQGDSTSSGELRKVGESLIAMASA